MKNSSIKFKSVIGADAAKFIAHKRALNRRYDVEEKTLMLLDCYLIEKSISRKTQITPIVIQQFLDSRPRERPRSYNHLLCTVRRLFEWMHQHDLISSVPVATKPRRSGPQRQPFIFDLKNARRLLRVAENLPDNPRASMRGQTYKAIFALLYGLGLRVGEVCRLHVGDVDFERRLLVMRRTKFYKDRLVPFGPKIEKMLKNYVSLKRIDINGSGALFSFTKRGEVNPGTVSQAFHKLVPELRLDVPNGVASPRLHDLRHSFAVCTLLRWYKEKKNPGTELLHLSTFLGHVDISSTAVYLNVTSELLHAANQRFEKFAMPALRQGLLS